MKKKTEKTHVSKVAVGLVAAGVAAAAAGYYFYGSKRAKDHRKIVAKWATDLKEDVIHKAKQIEKINARDFEKIVDTAASALRSARSIDATDLKRAANELKANWEMVRSEMKKASRKTVSNVKAVGKRAAASTKKTVKKVTKGAAAK